MEIAAYRKLLESEEQRLNISNVSHLHHQSGAGGQLGASYLEASKTSPSRSAAKRKRTSNEGVTAASHEESAVNYLETEQSTSGVQIGDHDMTGKQIKLINVKDKDVNVSGWKVTRKASGGAAAVQYVFATKSVVIKPGQHVTIWSSDAGVKQNAPTDFVLGQNQKWGVGDDMVTVLVDKDDAVSLKTKTYIRIAFSALFSNLKYFPC